MGSKNSKKTEDKAIIAVEQFFLQSQTVDTFLASNDKEPIWDGHFYLYSNPDAKKEHFIGRVPAQIKGKSVKKFKMTNFTYPIKMTDLNGYLHEGTYYIVVQETNTDSKIFYRELTPIVVRNIIRAHKGQNSVNVVMFQFPETIKEAETNLRQFMTDCIRQTSFADAEPFTFKDLKSHGITSFSFTKAIPDKTIPSMIAITQKPLYVYANISDKIKVPLGDGPMEMAFAKDVPSAVSVNGKTYYTHYKSEIEKGHATLYIGNCLAVTIEPKDDGISSISFKFETNIKSLRNAVNDANFITNLAKYKAITIGSKEFVIPKDFNQNFIEYWIDRFENWNALQQTLDILNIKEDLDLDLITEKDDTTANVLINMIKDKKEMSLKLKGTSIINLKFANIYIRLLAIKLKSGKYRLFNYFDRSVGIRSYYQYPDGKYQKSVYSSVDAKDLEECSNINFDDVIPSFEEIEDKNPHVYERANYFGLHLLNASDEIKDNETRRRGYLQCAETVFSWVMGKDATNKSLYFINIMQVRNKLGILSDKDRGALNTLLSSKDERDSVKFGASLILGDIKSAQKYWNMLDNNDHKASKQWPIWKLAEGKIIE